MNEMSNDIIELIVEGDISIIPDPVRPFNVENKEDNRDIKRCRMLGINKIDDRGNQVFAPHNDFWVKVQICDRNLSNSPDRNDGPQYDWHENGYFPDEIEIIEKHFRIPHPDLYKFGIYPEFVPVLSIAHLSEGQEITFSSYVYPISGEKYQIKTKLRANQYGCKYNELFGSTFDECLKELIKIS